MCLHGTATGCNKKLFKNNSMKLPSILFMGKNFKNSFILEN